MDLAAAVRQYSDPKGSHSFGPLKAYYDYVKSVGFEGFNLAQFRRALYRSYPQLLEVHDRNFKFPRRVYGAGGLYIDSLWSADVFVDSVSAASRQVEGRCRSSFVVQNRVARSLRVAGYLLIVDVFSRYLLAVKPMRNLKGAEAVRLFAETLKQSRRRPQTLQVRRGSETEKELGVVV